MTPSEFNARYWGAQSPAVQVLSGMDTHSDERFAKAWELARQGHSIDPDIMLRGGDPYWVQWYRLQNGYTWYPCLGSKKKVNVVPNVIFPTNDSAFEPYDPLNPPQGALKVSLDLADYPAVEPPPPLPPPVVGVPAAPNWALRTGSFCEAHSLDHSPDGTEYGGPEGKWRKSVWSAFGSDKSVGVRQYWMKVG